MFTIKFSKFDFQGNHVADAVGSSFRTKREAVAHLERNGFERGERKLPGYMPNKTMHVNAYIVDAKEL